jgi:hypothetical protein
VHGSATRPVSCPRALGGSTRVRLAFVASVVFACEEAAPPESTGASPAADARTPGGGFVPAKDASVFDPTADAGLVELPAPPSAPENCALRPSDPGPALIRRLNRREYDNTIRDLVGTDLAPAESFLPDEEFLGFDNQAASLQISPLHAEQYMTAAELVADHVAAHRGELLECDPALVGEVACVRAFIEGFGLRAWRRPLEAAEVDALAGLYDAAAALDPPQFDTALKLVVQALLESPNFLFRIEVGELFESVRLGEPGGLDPTRVRLSDWEIASRLSYLLWQTMPDAELFEAAARGELATRAQVQAQARRMLAHERARPAMLAFFDQWLRYAETLKIDRDPLYYPDFRPEYRDLLVTESRTFISNLVFGAERDLRQLFSASYTFMDETLARFYGVAGVEGPGFRRVELDPAQRAGILTHGAVMAATAKPNMTSPVFRGQYVRERVLCTPLPPPPPNIPVVPPSPDPNSSTREKFEEHDRNPACAGCHQLMDPIGYGFENFDAVGLWRTEENGHPIDSSCQLAATQDADGSFANGAEMARRLAESEQVQRCVVTQFYRFAQGRGETLADLCTLDGLYDAYAASGFDFLVMVEHLVASDAFRFRRRPPASGADESETDADAQESAR